MDTKQVIESIYSATEENIDVILDVARERKRELYPNWEIFYCAAEKGKINGPEEMIRAAWAFEKELKAKYG